MAQGVADRDAGEARAAQRALDARGRAPAADVIGGGVAEILRGAPGDLLDPEVPAAALDHRLIVAEEARTGARSEEHTSELQSLMRISYAVFCLKKKTQTTMSSSRHSIY